MTKTGASQLIEQMYVADQSSWTESDNSKLIQTNTEEIKKIINEFGCITISKFTEKISHYAWLLVQHANHDIQFQKDYLKLMEESNDVLLRDIAYLTDRICINQQLPQIYGTQFDPSTLKGDYSPFPIKDPESLDERRSKMGLQPIEEYKKYMWNKYKK